MKLAYLLNSYPMTSTTFIRREIETIERLGQPVTRFAVRHWQTELVDPDDQAEQDRTEYLLTGNAARLVGAAALDGLRRPVRLIAVLPLWWHLYRRAGGFVRHFGYLVQALFFRRRAAALGIDHVHAHFSTNAAGVAMLAQALGGPSYSFTVHGPDELVDPAANALACKVRRAAFVVAITEYCRGRILAEVPDAAAKVIVVRCGLDLADFPLGGDAPAAEGRFVCVGRLCENKAQILIPAAVAAVRDEHPQIVVELIGDGDRRAAIEAEIARLGVERNVAIAGWAANDAVRRRIAASSVLLLPSLAEGLPIVLMEALAIGRPVLTTRIAGIPELVDDRCGWIVAPGSVEALAGALRAALRTSPATLAAMGREGRRRIEAAHDINVSAAALLEAFRGAAAGPSRPHAFSESTAPVGTAAVSTASGA